MAVQAIPAPEPEPGKEPFAVESMTINESAMVERLSAQSIITFGNPAYPQATLIGAIGFVNARRQDPRLKHEAYLEGRTMAGILAELGMTGDDDEDTAAVGKEPGEST